MHGREYTCVDCGRVAPPTDDGKTISKQYGWRITRNASNGVAAIEARCHECHVRRRTSVLADPADRRRR